MILSTVLILFFLSGFTGLVYEVVWTRIFGLVFGNTTLAISTVLSAYMLGLALGSFLLGRIGDRIKNPLRLYAFLEIGIGFAAVFLILIQGVMEHIFIISYVHLRGMLFLFHILQFMVAFFAMFPATFLMGGTLPVLSHVVVKEKERLGTGVGTLYGVNTIGAMAGCFAAGFLLIRVLGVRATVFSAAIVNVLVAGAAFLLSNRKIRKPEVSVLSIGVGERLPRRRILVLIVMALSGFVTLSYEVLWSRILVFVMTNSVYAFAVMLTTFLCGIGIGSYFGGHWADRVRNPVKLLGWVECGIGVSGLIASIALIYLPGIHDHLFTIQPTTTWWAWNGIRFLEAFLVMLIPTFLIGATFPIAGRVMVLELSEIGKKLGILYFFNTLGCVFGSFLTGFVLIAIIGASASMSVMIAINLLIGISLILFYRKEFNLSHVLYPAFGMLILYLVISVTPKKLFTVAYMHVEKEYPLIDYREGIEGTVTVHEVKRPMEVIKRIDVDGLNVAGTSFMLSTLQILQGHLPMFVHANPEKVLQIGFGTGQTSRSALLHSLREFNVIEISRDVLELADIHFQDLNKGVIRHPQFEYTILDGKNFVKYTSEAYDVIMNDANYAVATGSASLFTKDHFEFCLKKLKPGGFLSTWMTIDLDPNDFKIVLRTFQSIFPYCTLWMVPNCINKQVVLVGSVEPWIIDFQKAQEWFDNQEIRENLASIHIHSVYDLLDCLILDHEGIEAISHDAAINTDNLPILEFSTRAIRSRDYCAYLNLGEILLYRPDLRNLIGTLPEKDQDGMSVENSLARHRIASGLYFKGMMQAYQGRMGKALNTLMEGSRIVPESRLVSYFFKRTDVVTQQLMIQASQQSDLLAPQLNLVRHLITLSHFEKALERLKALADSFPQNAMVAYETARCYAGLGNWDSARVFISKALTDDRKLAGAWYFLGEIQRRQGEDSQALVSLDEAIRLDPRMYEAYNAKGLSYKSKKAFPEAIECFNYSLDIMNYQPDINAHLADCYLEITEISEAIRSYRKALSMGHKNAQLLFNFGNALYMHREYAGAVRMYRRAIALDASNGEIYYNLGNGLIMQKQVEEAVEAFQKAVDLNPNEPDYFNNLALSYRELGRLDESLSVFERGLKVHPNSTLLRENARETKKLNR